MMNFAASLWRNAAVGMVLCMVFATSLFFFTSHNDFPHYYHGDETSKAKQIVSGKRNLRHPLLLLGASSVVMKVTGWKRTLQNAVVAGRWCSAVFGSLSIVLVCILALKLKGATGMLAVGSVVLWNPMLIEAAHIAKEDTALLAGFALVFLAVHLFTSTPDLRTAALLGLAASVALSAKYIGVIAVLISLVVLFAVPASRWPCSRAKRFAIFGVSFLLVFAAINFRLFMDIPVAVDEIQKQTERTIGLEPGVSGFQFNVYLPMLAKKTSLPIGVFFVLGTISLFIRKRRRRLVEWLVFLFPVAYLGMLCLANRSFERYLMPVSFFMSVGAALALADCALAAFSSDRSRIRIVFIGMILTALLVTAGWEMRNFLRLAAEYRSDDRKALTAWIGANLPANAVIAQNSLAGVPDRQLPNHREIKQFPSQKILSASCISEIGTVDRMRGLGVGYVVVTEEFYRRYIGQGSSQEQVYLDLFNRGTLRWQAQPGEIQELHPGLKLYDISEVGR